MRYRLLSILEACDLPFVRRGHLGARAVLLTSFAALALVGPIAAAGPPAAPHDAAAQVRAALDRMQAWLGPGENGRRWNAYLKSDTLAGELAKGASADIRVVAEVYEVYAAQRAEGLDRGPILAVRQALERWLDALGLPTADALPELALAAKQQFQPVPPERLVRARRKLQRRTQQLGEYLETGGANGEAWKRYLKWGALGKQLDNQASPDIGILVDVYRRLTADQPGLELPVFARVAAALEQYIDLASVARMPNLQEQYQSQLDALAAELARYLKEPQEADRRQIGTRVGWLEGTGFAPLLVASVRRRLSRPNYHLTASAALIRAGMHRSVETDEPVVDTILGTAIRGTAHTVGTVDARLVPSDRAAVIETVLRAKADTDTVGRNGPVVIYSDGVTEITAAKPIVIDAAGVRGRPASSCAAVDTHTRCIAATRPGCMGRVIERVAWRRVEQSKPRASAIAAEHAEARTARRIDRQAAPRLAKANRRFLDRFRYPLLRQRKFPRQFHLRTGDSQLMLTMLQADRFELGAPLPPPPIEGAPDLSVQIHESVVNNLASALLAGRTVTDTQLRQQVLDTFGRLPDELKEKEDDEPWSITFARQGPVAVALPDRNRLAITIRGQRFTSGERTFRAMNITARYRVARTDRGVRMERQGELEIVPPGFVPGKSRLSASQVALRRLLIKRLGALFKSEIVTDGLELPGNWKRIGKLPLIQMDIAGGWAALAWRLPAQASVADARGRSRRAG